MALCRQGRILAGLLTLIVLAAAGCGPGAGGGPGEDSGAEGNVRANVTPDAAETVVPEVTVPAAIETIGSTDQEADEALAGPTASPEQPGQANADVTFVRAVLGSEGTWTFHVTVSHPDAGWEDYADGWDIVTPEGTVLKAQPGDRFTRLLLHPHENEQPFTRSQSGIEIPAEVTRVTVRAHDLLHGFGGREVIVDLTATAGPGFEVVR